MIRGEIRLKIDRMCINHFGKFENKEIEFDKGLNIVYGANESGKSTIMAFIKAMLYSLTKKEERKYLPWGRSEFGTNNTLTYTLDNQQTYTVERNFNRKTTSIYMTEPYQEVTALFPVHKNNVLFMEEHIGLNEAAFESSILIKQLGIKVGDKGSKDIVERLVRLSQYGDENIDYNNAIKKLDEIKDTIGVGNLGKHKKLVQVNQSIANLQAELEQALYNVRAAQALQQETNQLYKEQQALKKEIEDLLTIKQYKKLPLLHHYEAAKNRLEECRKKQEMLERQLSVYDTFAHVTEQDIRTIETELNKIQMLEQQAEELAVKIERQTNEKEKMYQQVKSESESFVQADVRIQLIEDKVHQLRSHLSIADTVGIIGILLSILGGWTLGKTYPAWYALFLVPPAAVFLLMGYHKNVKSRIAQWHIRQQQLSNELMNNEEVQVINKLIQSLNADHKEIRDRIGHGYAALISKMEALGFDDVEKSIISMFVHELKQAFDARMDILRQLEESKKEIAAVSESLEIASKTTADMAWDTLAEIDERQYRERCEKYGIDEHMTAAQVEQCIEEKKQQLKEIELSISANHKEIEIISKEYRHPGDLEEQLKEAFDEKQEYEDIKEAVDIAKGFLKESLKEIQQNYAPLLNQQMNSILSTITDEKYNKVDTNSSLDVVIHDMQNGVIDLNLLSNGTIDQIYFALRLAVAQMLSVKETLPLIIDEAFAQYDDQRLRNTIAFLLRLAKQRQILLFTCQKRELDILEDLKGIYKKILI
jgi:DNA repair exonuclease SbcCD ATPase subunit